MLYMSSLGTTSPMWSLPKSISLAGVALVACILTGCASNSKRIPEQDAHRAFETGAPARLNPYITKAVTNLFDMYGEQGYANSAFTHELKFGNRGSLAATSPPHTMCVAAQLEVLVEALNLYAGETNDYTAFAFLPKSSWEHLHASDFRGKIWMVEGANSSGAADALKRFGMGTTATFEAAQPGDFINFNRANGTGHGVVFLAFLDHEGKELPSYGPTVAGFKYFSSQGKLTGGGLGYRYAFFFPDCPTLPGNQKRDCNVIRSASQNLLSVGFAFLPSAWDRNVAQAALAAPTIAGAPEGAFDAAYFSEITTDD
jgi:hypothetical protein